ncbi:MAG: DUF4988 domain-containing protein, partial [Alistipes sp.]|nr:DUF4988 domain-containing protein [Alistipes sp.]
WASTIDGKTDFMYAEDTKTQKIPVTGQDGTTPEIGVDEEGYWTVNGDRVQWKGKDLPATTEGYIPISLQTLWTMVVTTRSTLPTELR